MAVHAVCSRNPDKRLQECRDLSSDLGSTLDPEEITFLDPLSDTGQGDGLCRSSCNSQEKCEKDCDPLSRAAMGGILMGKGVNHFPEAVSGMNTDG